MQCSFECYSSADLFAVKMGRCKDLTTAEKQIIVTHLRSGMSTVQIQR